MGPEEKKEKTFAEEFAEAFEAAMKEEHEEYEAMPKRFAPGEGVYEVVEPEGEGHFEL